MATETLIVFSRYPAPGTTKTRLIPALGPAGAAELQRRMTETLVRRSDGLKRGPGLEIELRYTGGRAAAMRAWLGGRYAYRPQGAGDLGRRMLRALRAALGRGSQAAVLAGTDIPGLDAAVLTAAFEALEHHPLVVGPAADGGYYLLGLQREALKRGGEQLFDGIPWGTPGVLAATLRRAERLNLNCARTAELGDVDRPEDLHRWVRRQPAITSGPDRRRISVVIPAIDEASNLPPTIHSLVPGCNVEVIVVDGGSQDDTAAIAEGLGARVLRAAPPRSRQMNAGAAAASGQVLLFLHADTRVPLHYDRLIRRALAASRVTIGAFELAIDAPGTGLRWIEKVANLRSRYLRMPYGDQGLFLTRAAFQRLGAFPPVDIMEDYLLVRRAARRGRVVIVPRRVRTSSRRWQRLGVVRTWLINQTVVAGHLAGVPIRRLARLYRRGGDEPQERPGK